MSGDEEIRFRDWLDKLALRISASVLPREVEKRLVEYLKTPSEGDQMLGLVSGYMRDDRLKNDFVKAVMIFDGTARVCGVAEDGAPIIGVGA